MKIIQVAGALGTWGGIERYICNLSEGLTDLDYNVFVACPKGSPLEKKYLGSKLILEKKPKIHFLTVSQYIRGIKDQHFDLIHAHYSPDFAAVAIAARVCKIPRIVLSRHVALPWAKPKAIALSTLYDRMICVSDAVKDVLESSGVPTNKLIVAKMGIRQLEPTQPKPKLRKSFGMSENAYAFGFVGRLTIEKGVKTLLFACSKLPAEIDGKQVEVHIFGGGPQHQELVSTVNSNSSRARLVFHGQLEDVSDAMSSVDALVVPSEWIEAFPAVILEAMCLGVPVIASRIGGIPEIIIDHETGLLVPVGNADILFQAMLELAQDRSLSGKVGANGRALQQKDYTIPAMAQRFSEVFDSIPAYR